MKVYELQDPGSLRRRAHPWVHADGDPGARYHDLRKHPERIRTALEDLVPWAEHAAIETWYQLLEWLNGPDSTLESNDCAFTGLAPNDGAHCELRYELSGRMMVLFRDLPRNTVPSQVAELTRRVAYLLSLADPTLEHGVIGASIVPVQFVGLPVERQDGLQLLLSFWAWGDDDAEAYGNLDRTLLSLGTVLRKAAMQGREA